MATKLEVPSQVVATAALAILRNTNFSKTARSAAGLSLSQRLASEKNTSSILSTVALNALRSKSASKSSMIAAGYDLTQRSNGKR